MKHHISMMATLILVVFGSTGCTELAPYHDKNGSAIGPLNDTETRMDKVNANRQRGVPSRDTIVALASDAVSDYMDQQQGEIEREFAQELQSHSLDLQRLEKDMIQLSLPGQTFLNTYSSNLQTNSRAIIAKLASIIRKFDKTAVHVIGHTDSSGTKHYNQQLSERRTDAITYILGSHGIGYNRLRSEGRGEMDPLTSNETAEGRQRNRRVEIFLKPIVEGQIEWAFTTPS
ncbi:MAG: OmpA family protein [Nitrospirales bacterium]